MKNLNSWFILSMIVLLIILSFRGYLVDPQQALEAAQKQGIASVKITDSIGVVAFVYGCGSDSAAFRARGINASGEEITFVICSGWPFKGFTIRY